MSRECVFFAETIHIHYQIVAIPNVNQLPWIFKRRNSRHPLNYKTFKSEIIFFGFSVID